MSLRGNWVFRPPYNLRANLKVNAKNGQRKWTVIINAVVEP